MKLNNSITVVDANNHSVTGTVYATREYLAGIKAGILIVYLRNEESGDKYRMVVWPYGIINRITKIS